MRNESVSYYSSTKLDQTDDVKCFKNKIKKLTKPVSKMKYFLIICLLYGALCYAAEAKSCCDSGYFNWTHKLCINENDNYNYTYSLHKKCAVPGTLVKQSNNIKFQFENEDTMNITFRSEKPHQSFQFKNYCKNGKDEVVICQKIAFLKRCCNVTRNNEFRCASDDDDFKANNEVIESEDLDTAQFVTVNVVAKSKQVVPIDDIPVVYQNGFLELQDVEEEYCYKGSGLWHLYLVEAKALTPVESILLCLKFISIVCLIICVFVNWKSTHFKKLYNKLLISHAIFVLLELILSIAEQFVLTEHTGYSNMEIAKIFATTSSFAWCV